jgi:hypothetical protein
MRSMNVFSAATVSLFLVFAGCVSNHSANNRTRQGVQRQGSMISSPLNAAVLRPEILSAVNSIEVAQPVIKQSGIAATISPQDAYVTISKAARETMTLKVMGGEPGRSLSDGVAVNTSADAVLRTEILRFEERSGSAFGGEPAVVSFRMVMYSPRGRADIWSAQYFLKQEALSENLLRIGERVGPSGLGAGWSTAQEVFKKGIREALQDFNSQREQSFVVGAGGEAKR